ncbi:integrase core domain-containing protein [Streptomyces sp. NPDC002285]
MLQRPVESKQYTSRELRCKLRSLGLRASVGRTGVCGDNAMAESFFGALKNKLAHRTTLPTRAHAHRAIVRYIEIFYNRKRLHSRLGYKTPAEVHAEYEELQAAGIRRTLNAAVREAQGPSGRSCQTMRRPHRPGASGGQYE